MTTAQLREQAREAERQLDWAQAAHLWQCAIDCYPWASASKLVQCDLQRMTARRDDCKREAARAS